MMPIFSSSYCPAPRDREGLPDSVRFWKTRIEERDADETFPVGLLYGPSGCGKSSFIKAGLLPHLSNDVTAVYLEASPGDTEARLLNGLRKRGGHLPADLDLVQAMTRLRSRDHEPYGKLLIVIDQFEQWLHSASDFENADLTRALRQCDGANLQCLLMVRDDFWMATTRFMRELEIHLVEGENSAASDLFHPRHARKVLAAFGQALGDLPDTAQAFSRDNRNFIEQAVNGLISDGRVISVRLALFAQMMRGKPWTATTLRHVGGFEGLGIVFLEETFSESTAPPENRYHERAVRAVLKTLLPIADSDIKGHMRSGDELLEASGYADRPRDFEALIRLLDKQLRLIAPTDPAGLSADDSIAQAGGGNKYYQLSHDYLVPAIREWLTRKLKATRGGRASLRLTELATFWHAKPENRRLPSWIEWARIRLFTRRQTWTEPQRRMMRVAGGRHLMRAAGLVLLMAAAGYGVRLAVTRAQANALVENLTTADTTQITPLLAKLDTVRWWINDSLQSIAAANPEDSKKHLHAGLALLAVDEGQIEYLREQLLVRPPDTALVVRDILAPHAENVAPWLWEQVENEQVDVGRRFRAALALAGIRPPQSASDEAWARNSELITVQLIDASLARPGHYVSLTQGLRPARTVMLDHLHEMYRHGDLGHRRMATNILLDYAADQPELRFELLLDANLNQFPQIWSFMESDHEGQRRESTVIKYLAELAGRGDSGLSAAEQRHLASRRANAAVALMRLGRFFDVWPLLQEQKEPLARNMFIHRLRPLGGDPSPLLRRLSDEPNVIARRALLLALGEFDFDAFPAQLGQQAVLDVKEIFLNCPDSGAHAAAEWLLRTWKQTATLEVAYPLLPNEEQRAERSWYRTPADYTMVIVDGRKEADIGRVYEIAATEVTLGQFRQFREYHYAPDTHNELEIAAGVVNWYHAIAYCQWLNEQEGISESQWCYPKFDPDEKVLERFQPDLTRTGYRLLTEAEWIYACRGGTKGGRYFGESDELLDKYAWYRTNSNSTAQPPGLLKPNDFGLFDMLGNMAEWLAGKAYSERVLIATNGYGSAASHVEIHAGEAALPRTKFNMYGFRIGRTRELDE